MQRYHAATCSNAVNNSAIGLTSARENARAESPALPSGFSLNSRRPAPLAPYKLKCEKEPLNSRLGPPDYHPQTPDCPEETLTREYVQSGYKEMVEGLEEAREILLSQVEIFTKPVVIKCKEAIRKRLRAINESRAKKRKAGQVYGVPLSGSSLSKAGAFPEQRPCSEDFRRRWIEGLSQPHKRLRSLADHVPHGYRRKSLFEVLIKYNVPLLRATWFIKVTYLNQVRPGSSGTPEKGQLSRTELWTKDVIDYLQCLLDEFIKNSSYSNPQFRDRSPKVNYSESTHQKAEPMSSSLDGEEPSLHFKWWYAVRLLQWHHAEGLLLPSLVIEWVLNQLQDREIFEILQLLLPIIYGVIEAVVLSQNYVRGLVGVSLRYIREPSPGGSYLADNSNRAYTYSAVIEMLRYMMLAVPDTFVSLDCFPLPSCVVSKVTNDGGYVSKASEEVGKLEIGSRDIAYMFRRKRLDALYQSKSFDHLVSRIRKCSDKLAESVRKGNPCRSYAKAVQALDKALVQGDLRSVYKFLFEDFCDGAVDGGWIKEANPCLRSSLKCIGTLNLSFIHTVFFLCEWATCDFRNFRTSPLNGMRFTGRRDFSEVYVVIWFLLMKARDLRNEAHSGSGEDIGVTDDGDQGLDNVNSGPTSGADFFQIGYGMDHLDRSSVDVFESPGPLHDILVCWIDQHETQKGEALERLQLLIVELTRFGIFFPQAYVRQLLVSGIMDLIAPVVDVERQMRHCQVLKLLPEVLVHDALTEMRIADESEIFEAVCVYSNERQLVLRDHFRSQYGYPGNDKFLGQKLKKQYPRDVPSPASVDHWKSVESPSDLPSFRKVKSGVHIDELKTAISALMQFPSSDSGLVDTVVDESEGSVKRSAGSMSNKIELTDGCEDCRRVKKQKLAEERSLYIQAHSPTQWEEDLWWVRKGHKQMEPLRIDPLPNKPTKQTSRGKQKIVRKTQSLAQLAAARIEGSQGATTSHVCDNRINCPHHRTVIDGELPKAIDGAGPSHYGDLISIGKALKRLRFAKRRVVTSWLINLARQLIEESEKASSIKAGQFNNRNFPIDESSSLKWKLGEDELSAILYLMDVSNDLVLAIKFLLWLLPKALRIPISTIHSGRNLLTLQRHMESHVCEVGEAFLLSSLRRYENTLVAADLIPQTLSALMHRAAAAVASNGRVSGTSALAYARYLLKKYGIVSSVLEWRKNFKATCNKRLLSELELGRPLDGEHGFALGAPTGADDLDDFLHQKLSSSRISRVGMAMRDIVQRHIEDAFHFYSAKEKKFLSAGGPKGPMIDKGDEGYQKAQQILMGLMDCIRQTGGAAQEGDPSLVCSAVSAIIGSVGPTLAKIPDFGSGSNYVNTSFPTAPSSYVAKRILRIHITSLCLLKEALGERQSRVFEVALATEALSALSDAFSPGKMPRNQYQLSPEAHDSSVNTDSAKGAGRSTRIAAAVSALVIRAVLQGVTSLERMVAVFRLKDGLDVCQFVKSLRSNSNGNTRSTGLIKGDGLLEVYIHWFRLLIGNCRTVSDGLIVELLGEPSVLALSRMQQSLPLTSVFPPAYAIFAFLVWRPYILNAAHVPAREDIHQLYLTLNAAMGDALKHLPFRDVCMRNTRGLYDLIAADGSDAELAEMLNVNCSDVRSKGFVPLRARLFLDAIIDCRMPTFFTQNEPKVLCDDNGVKLVDKIVHVLNSLQPAKFHWQWLELRLLLNEQALIEKLGSSNDLSLKEVMRSLSLNPERAAASDNESNVIEIILTRLLVRPDAAPLYSEAVHLLGRSLEDSMLLLTKWFLEGNDVLLGRKTVRQRLINIAEKKGLSTNLQSWKHLGWAHSGSDAFSSRNNLDKSKSEVNSLEEGEVIEEGLEMKKKYGRGLAGQSCDAEGSNIDKSHATEKALIELILLCMDQSSDEARYTFASDLIKQLNAIEQQMNMIGRGMSKQAGNFTSAADSPVGKTSSRKGGRGGSPGMAARRQAVVDSAPPSPAALRDSIFLRLHFLLRSLPVICADREPLGKNMRHMLTSIILRLLGNRLIYEDAELPPCRGQSSLRKRDAGDMLMEARSVAASQFPGESLFYSLLLILHGLLGSSQPSWLRSKRVPKVANESRDFCGFEKEVAESLQNELESMQIPDKIRWRIQAAMPVLIPSLKFSFSCQPPSVPMCALASVQPSLLPTTQRTSQRSQSSSMLGKLKASSTSQQENEPEFDSWTILEDGVGSTLSAGGISVMVSADSANLRASSWLKGAVRVRRTDLTYVGPVDEDS